MKKLTLITIAALMAAASSTAFAENYDNLNLTLKNQSQKAQTVQFSGTGVQVVTPITVNKDASLTTKNVWKGKSSSIGRPHNVKFYINYNGLEGQFKTQINPFFSSIILPNGQYCDINYTANVTATIASNGVISFSCNA